MPVDGATLEGQEADGENQADERYEDEATDDEHESEDPEESSEIPDRCPYCPQKWTKDQQQKYQSQAVYSEGNQAKDMTSAD